MANHLAKGKSAKHGENLVQRTRAGILNAFDAVERRGVKISDALADAFLADPLKFMDTAAKYIPKGADIGVQHITSAIQLTDEQLIQIIGCSQNKPEKQVSGQVLDQDQDNTAQLVKE